MSKKLVIVESPTKAKTISRFLGKEYTVLSSYGHIRDLPKNKMGIDIEHDFAPDYVIPKMNQKRLTPLRASVKKSTDIILATDEDREGEAIAWHLTQALDIDPTKTKRIVFHEITKEAIEEALAHPREIYASLVDAQQARRLLDRLVGYELSPLLWKKVARGLSAGRVQSVALRLVVEREKEIHAFTTEEYWTISATLEKTGAPPQFVAKLIAVDEKKLEKFSIKKEEEAKAIVNAVTDAPFRVHAITQKTKNVPRSLHIPHQHSSKTRTQNLVFPQNKP